MTNSQKLRKLIYNKDLFIMEAHDGISAKIAEEAGFECLWASGLTISASKGKRDNNELSYKEIVEHISDMVDSVKVPILMDADTGYGDWNTARIFAKRAYKAGIAGICIEDKLFPKKNSFLENSSDLLEDPYIFSSKIKAIRESCHDLVIVARIESLIAGLDVEDALNRARIYKKAGADAILIHSKKPDGKEIIDFLTKFKRESQIPVIVVPTKYPEIPAKDLFEAGASTIIWANHNLRASIKAMKEISEKLFKEKSIIPIEESTVSVSEIFRLQGNKELEEAEERYAINRPRIKSLILAAGVNDYIPRCNSEILGRTILDWTLERLGSSGISSQSAIISEIIDTHRLDYSQGHPPIEFYRNLVSTLKSHEMQNVQNYFNEKFGIVENSEEEYLITFGDLWFSDRIQKEINNIFLEDNDVLVLETLDGKFLGVVKLNASKFIKFMKEYNGELGWSLEKIINYYICSKERNKKVFIISDSSIIDVNNIDKIS